MSRESRFSRPPGLPAWDPPNLLTFQVVWLDENLEVLDTDLIQRFSHEAAMKAVAQRLYRFTNLPTDTAGFVLQAE